MLMDTPDELLKPELKIDNYSYVFNYNCVLLYYV
jgi:hypothetical protein